MSIEVEVSLRIPNSKVRALDAQGFPIDHAAVRFRKRMQLPELPKAGVVIEVDTRSQVRIPCEVNRSDWSEDQGLFVLACRYAGRSMSPDQRDAILHDTDWKMTPLI